MTTRDERKKELEAELKAIRDEEEKERDLENFNRLVKILDNPDVILGLIDHSRTSCSDENPGNGYTTMGRGGHFRCNKCGFMNAIEDWKSDREWLIGTESGKVIEEHLAFYFHGIELNVTTDVE